jgi:hypothetical protein
MAASTLQYVLLPADGGSHQGHHVGTSLDLHFLRHAGSAQTAMQVLSEDTALE